MSGRLPTIQILVLIDTVEASPQIGEILPLSDFDDCPVLTFFLRSHAKLGRTAGPILTLDGSNDVFPRIKVPFGLERWMTIFRENMPKPFYFLMDVSHAFLDRLRGERVGIKNAEATQGRPGHNQNTFQDQHFSEFQDIFQDKPVQQPTVQARSRQGIFLSYSLVISVVYKNILCIYT